MNKLTRLAKTATALSLGVALAACQTTGTRTSGTGAAEKSYCEAQPAICALIGAVVVGGVIAVASSTSGGNMAAATPAPSAGGGGVIHNSDMRLKSDIRWVQTLENGIRLHAYRYKGDDQVFVGVLAQELLADERYAHAVLVAQNGALKVDYGALGLELVGASKMRDAGEQALARFESVL